MPTDNSHIIYYYKPVDRMPIVTKINCAHLSIKSNLSYKLFYIQVVEYVEIRMYNNKGAKNEMNIRLR